MRGKILAWTLRLVFFGVFGSCVFFGYKFGKRVEFSSQWPLFEALRTTASIIFAVVGAWLAIIYPERLRLSFGQNGKTAPDSSLAGVWRLLSPAIHSTAILCIVLVIGVTAPILKELAFVEPHREVFRGISYAMLVSLTLWQLITVVLTLVPAEVFKSHVEHEMLSNEMLDGLTKIGQRKK